MCQSLLTLSSLQEPSNQPAELEHRAGLVAVLAMLGGVDPRLRLGGQATLPDLDKVTITAILPKGKVRVMSAQEQNMRLCKLQDLTPVCHISYTLYLSVRLQSCNATMYNR